MNVLGKPLRLIFLCNQDNYKKKKQNPEQIRIKCKVFYSLCFQHSLKNAVLSLLCQVLTSKYSAIVFLSSLFKISNFCLFFFLQIRFIGFYFDYHCCGFEYHPVFNGWAYFLFLEKVYKHFDLFQITKI